MEGEELQGDPAARRRKRVQQHRGGGGRRRGRAGHAGGEHRKHSSASNGAVLLPPAGSSNYAHRCGHRSNPALLFAGSGGSSLVSSSATSAASERADLCSFGSDHDGPPGPQKPPAPHLAGSARRTGPDRCREKRRPSFETTTPHASTEVDQDPLAVEGEGQEEREALDPAKNSFSIALKACQNRRFRSDVLGFSPAEEKHRRRRPASLDLNGTRVNEASFSSPGLTAGQGMKSSTVSARSRSGTFPSPTTPNYRNGVAAAGYHKGWSSERVPPPANSSRRYGSTSTLLPFNNGRTLPSKWEDAEKWIFSPLSGEVGMGRSTGVPPRHRRPKSKSGPLGTPAGMSGSYSSASPPIPVFDRGGIRNFAESSPFLTGVLIPDRGCCNSTSSGRGGSGSEGAGTGGGEVRGRRSYSVHGDEGIVRSASVHGCTDLLLQTCSSLPSSRDEGFEGAKDETIISPPVTLRKNVATQMSPQDSGQSSPKEQLQFSPSTASSPTIEEVQDHFSKMEVRDVQVDDRVTVTRWSKKHIARGTDKSSSSFIEWKKKIVESRASSWEVAKTSKSISKFKREEAKIAAWENLQKAKAEEAIRKLEMKLEQKRSSSMDKILSKLKLAQRKAQEMRNAVTASQITQVDRTPKVSSSSRMSGHMSSFSGCFACHAF